MDAQNTVMKNAEEAYKTSGLSANEYMEQVTSFSASLINSLNGDTAQAAIVADRAIIDMSDNANKMGTSMEAIQNAYNGFAKQNYTMLDNLKLGYGGTKTEMERLIEDASKMTDLQEQLNIKVEEGDMSFANIANAISIVQANMGISGTTSKEAAATIEGSTKAMQAAWKNLVAGIGNDNADLDKLINDFIDTLLANFDNIAPRFEKIFTGVAELINKGLPKLLDTVFKLLQDNMPLLLQSVLTMIQGILDGVTSNIGMVTEMILEIVKMIAQILIENLPTIVDAGIQLILALAQGLSEMLPTLIPAAVQAIVTIVETLAENQALLVEVALQLILALTDGLIAAIPVLIPAIPDIVMAMVNGFIDHAPELAKAALEIILALAQGLIDYVDNVLKAISEMIDKMYNKFIDFDWAKLGHEVIEGIKKGLTEKATKLYESVKEIAGKVVDGWKSLIGSDDKGEVSGPTGKHEGTTHSIGASAGASIQTYTSGINGANYSSSGSIYGNMNNNVTVVLEGDAAGVFNLVRTQNTKMVKSTGFNPLMVGGH